jgi:8-hydroxy-5-deazaflavin:NADPH oxidoreductase
MERLQKHVPAARFVKAFNSIGNALMVNPKFDTPPTMFICGNDAAAKQETTEILTKFGWETADMGAVEGARPIESLCILWCIPGFLRKEWMHAFKLVKSRG